MVTRIGYGYKDRTWLQHLPALLLHSYSVKLLVILLIWCMYIRVVGTSKMKYVCLRMNEVHI